MMFAEMFNILFTHIFTIIDNILMYSSISAFNNNSEYSQFHNSLPFSSVCKGRHK